MTAKRKSFVIHIDSLDILDDLSNEQAGMLFNAIRAHHNGTSLELDAITKIAFSPFKNQFKRDDENYIETVERNRINGLKGGRPRKRQEAEESKETQVVINKPKKADNDSKSDSDSKNKSDSKKEILDFSPLALSSEEIKEFKTLRSKKKAAITQRVINDHAKQFNLSRQRGYTNDDILSEWSNRGWTAYKDEWMRVNPTKKSESKTEQPQIPVIDEQAMIREMMRNGI